MKHMPTGAFSSVPMTISFSRSDRIFQPRACVPNRARPGSPWVSTTMWWSRTGKAQGVERTGEVLQAAVNLEGDHAVAGTEPAGDFQRGGEVRAGGRPGEDA